jgi:hypothetical protein
MDDAREETRFLVAWVLAAVILMAVLVLYPLSTGPVVSLLDDSENSDIAIQVLYWPLIWLCERSEAIDAFFEWYVGLWD